MLLWKTPEYQIIYTEEELSKLCNEIESAYLLSIDTETTGVYPESGLNNFLGWILGISICLNKNKGYYIPISHNAVKQLSIETVKKHLNPVLSKDKLFIGHNLKFDYKFLWQAGIELYPKFWDTMIAISLINGDTQKSRKLKSVIKNYIDIPGALINTFEEIAEGQVASKILPEDIAVYAINDTIFTLYLYEALKPIIDRDYFKLFYEAESQLTPILAQMELKGIKIDKDYLDKIKEPLIKYKYKIQTFFKKKYGAEISSTQQVGKLFNTKFKTLNLKKKFKTNNVITDEDALQTIQRNHPKTSEVYKVAKRVLTFRNLNKALTTYIESYPSKCLIHYNSDPEYILHTDFFQIVNSGRMSSSPNIQNIPRSKEINIRKAFVARKGYKFIEADYKGQELRLVACISKEPKLLNPYLKDPINADIHLETAKAIYEKEDISPEERWYGKTLGFTILYGGTEQAVSDLLNISKEKARDLVNKYNNALSGLYKWKQMEEKKINDIGYSESLWGRRRYLPLDLDASWKYRKAVRQLINSIIQSSAADQTKFAMVKIAKKFAEKDLDAYILNAIHDSVLIEAKNEIIDEVIDIVKNIMEVTINGLLFPVDIEIKNNYSK